MSTVALIIIREGHLRKH